MSRIYSRRKNAWRTRRHHYHEELRSAKAARGAASRVPARVLANRFWREYYRLHSARCADPQPALDAEIVQRLRAAMVADGMIDAPATDKEVFEQIDRWLGDEGHRSERGRWIERVLSS